MSSSEAEPISSKKGAIIGWTIVSILCSSLFLWLTFVYIYDDQVAVLFKEVSLRLQCESDLLYIALCSFIVLSLRAWRLTLLVEGLSLHKAFNISASHNALTRILPFRVGELSLPVLLSRHTRISLLEGGMLMLWLRLLEIVCLAPFLLLCFLLTFGETMPLSWLSIEQISPAILLFVLSGFVIYALQPITTSVLHGLLNISKRFAALHTLKQKLELLSSQTSDESPKNVIGAGLLTSLILCAQATLFLFMIRLSGGELPWGTVGFGSAVVHIAGVIPAPTVGNIGTHELGWTLIYSKLGLENTIALTSATLSQWITMILAMLWASMFMVYSLCLRMRP